MTVAVTEPAAQRAASRPPLSSRGRVVLLAAVAACAACGLIYELALLTLSASLVGGGITQTSMIVAGYVAALGVGALVAKPFVPHAAVAFVVVEIALGLVGGFCAAALYVSFTFLGSATALLVVGTALIGVLVGAEVPLLMTLLQTGRRDGAEESGKILANLNAADYAGALVGGLLWPFLLLPAVGMIRGAAITGIVNLVAAAVVALVLLRGWIGVRTRAVAVLALVSAAGLILGLLVAADDIETTSRQRLYTDPVIVAERSQYQEIVVTRRGDDTRLFLDGDLQFSSVDEHRYTESLVYPALSGGPERVLVLGGGDGLAAREILRTGVREIVQVELDPAVIDLAGTTLAPLNGGGRCRIRG